MVQIYCYNWNLYLPPEGIFDSTCGYHALRNGNEMLSILNINDLEIDDNYISNLKNNSDKLKSKVDLVCCLCRSEIDIKKLRRDEKIMFDNRNYK